MICPRRNDGPDERELQAELATPRAAKAFVLIVRTSPDHRLTPLCRVLKMAMRSGGRLAYCFVDLLDRSETGPAPSPALLNQRLQGLVELFSLHPQTSRLPMVVVGLGAASAVVTPVAQECEAIHAAVVCPLPGDDATTTDGATPILTVVDVESARRIAADPQRLAKVRLPNRLAVVPQGSRRIAGDPAAQCAKLVRQWCLGLGTGLADRNAAVGVDRAS